MRVCVGARGREIVSLTLLQQQVGPPLVGGHTHDLIEGVGVRARPLSLGRCKHDPRLKAPRFKKTEPDCIEMEEPALLWQAATALGIDSCRS